MTTRLPVKQKKPGKTGKGTLVKPLTPLIPLSLSLIPLLLISPTLFFNSEPKMSERLRTPAYIMHDKWEIEMAKKPRALA